MPVKYGTKRNYGYKTIINKAMRITIFKTNDHPADALNHSDKILKIMD